MIRQPILAKKPVGTSLSKDRWQVVGICLVLAGITLAVFAQAAHFSFINLDDDVYAYANPRVLNGLSWKGFVWEWTHADCYFYHPLTMLSLMLDDQLHGPGADGFHLSNVLIHAVSTVLLFLSLRRMTGAIWRSAFVAAVFAIHPLRAESVAWIADRKDILSGLFFMLTLWAYSSYARQPSWSRYVSVVMAFALGLLCKNMLVTLPVVLLLLDWWPLGRLTSDAGADRTATIRRLVLEKVPLFFLSALAVVVGLPVTQKLSNADRLPMLVRAGNAVVSYVLYLWQMVFPAKLMIPYLLPSGGWTGLEIGLALALLAAIFFAVWAFRKEKPYLLVGWLWYLVVLSPVIGFIQVSYHSHADRYTYLPSIGLALAVAWVVGEWSLAAKWRQLTAGLLMMVVVGALMFCARIQTGYWKDGETLWTHVLTCEPTNRIALNNLGNALLLEGKADQAEAWLEKAVTANPNSSVIHVDLGLCYLQLGRIDRAIAQYQTVLDLDPNNADFQNDLAWILATGSDARLRDGGKAVELASSANTQTGGKNPAYLDTLAAAFAEAGRFPAAVDTAQKALPLAESQLNASLAEELRSELKLYQSGKPFHMPAPSPPSGNH